MAEKNGAEVVKAGTKTESYFTDENLHACGKCSKYKELKPHKRSEDGKLYITCGLSSKKQVLVRTDIHSPEQCKLFQFHGKGSVKISKAPVQNTSIVCLE